MRTLLIAISLTGLALTLIPSFFVFAQMLSREMYTMLMTVGTVLWFATAPFWMKKEEA